MITQFHFNYTRQLILAIKPRSGNEVMIDPLNKMQFVRYDGININ
jgi:hypothetical protein